MIIPKLLNAGVDSLSIKINNENVKMEMYSDI